KEPVPKKPTKRKSEAVENNRKNTGKGKGRKLQDPSTVDVPKIVKKNSRRLTPRKQKLLEQELSSRGKSNAEMAKAAGYKAQNLSHAFVAATQSDNYQEALAKSKAELRRKIGIPGEVLLQRLIEIGLTRTRDVAVLDNGVLRLRDDVDFDEDGADLAIKGFTIKTTEIKTKHKSETKKELKVETSDNKGALIEAIKIGGYFADSVYNSMEGGNEEIRELWKRFKDREISANDLSMELSMRGCFVPPPVQLQAKAELVALAKGGGDDDLSDIDLMETYDEMLENDRIEKKKRDVETERKRELVVRERELEALNEEDDKDIVIHADQDEEADEG
ncbi:MAG: hypothetical protein GY866_36440, partial [Proteobacteria bacterium]|nr:hypothetical protein [Pseudomonadota bacterium]